MGIQEDIDVLENKVARLKVEYEQFFLRVVKQPPTKTREAVEKLILSYHGKNITNSSHKFRLNNVISKFNTYRNYWDRALRSIEEGTFNRKAEGGMGNSTPPVLTPTDSVSPEPKQKAEAAPAVAQEQPQERQAPAPVAASGADDIYNRYIAARKECNESTSGITPEALLRNVDEFKKKVMAQYNVKDVDVKVTVKDGKAKLIIVPKK